MAIRIKVDPVARTTEASIRAHLTSTEQRQAAAAFASAGIEEAKQANQRILGRSPPYTVTVDGRQGAALDTVNPDGGSIVVEFDLVADVLGWIAQTLIDRSPEISGDYKRGHKLFADGQEVAVGGDIPPADQYTFINVVPYARKIEVGKTEGGRDFVIQVPNKIYERTAKDAKARFGNLADIQFGYAQAIGAYTLKRNQAARHFLKGGRVYVEPKQRRDRVAGAAVVPPAIIVTYKRG